MLFEKLFDAAKSTILNILGFGANKVTSASKNSTTSAAAKATEYPMTSAPATNSTAMSSFYEDENGYEITRVFESETESTKRGTTERKTVRLVETERKDYAECGSVYKATREIENEWEHEVNKKSGTERESMRNYENERYVKDEFGLEAETTHENEWEHEVSKKSGTERESMRNYENGRYVIDEFGLEAETTHENEWEHEVSKNNSTKREKNKKFEYSLETKTEFGLERVTIGGFCAQYETVELHPLYGTPLSPGKITYEDASSGKTLELCSPDGKAYFLLDPTTRIASSFDGEISSGWAKNSFEVSLPENGKVEYDNALIDDLFGFDDSIDFYRDATSLSDLLSESNSVAKSFKRQTYGVMFISTTITADDGTTLNSGTTTITRESYFSSLTVHGDN